MIDLCTDGKYIMSYDENDMDRKDSPWKSKHVK